MPSNTRRAGEPSASRLRTTTITSQSPLLIPDMALQLNFCPASSAVLSASPDRPKEARDSGLPLRAEWLNCKAARSAFNPNPDMVQPLFSHCRLRSADQQCLLLKV